MTTTRLNDITLTSGAVTIDGDPVFPALVGSHRWNGWAIPYFTREVAQQVADWFVASYEPGLVSAHWDGDALTLDDTEITGDTGNPERCEPVLIDGVPYWCIGGFSWTWESVNA